MIILIPTKVEKQLLERRALVQFWYITTQTQLSSCASPFKYVSGGDLVLGAIEIACLGQIDCVNFLRLL